MFWGLIMEPQRRYTQVVKKSFHISMAALDISTSGDDPTQVICAYEGRNYLLCTLNKNGVVQCALDLQFESGTEVSFATNGSSHVHLTGYLTDELDLESDGEEEDVEEEEETVVEQPRKKKGDKLENGPAKKQKKENIVSSSKSDEEDESDDSDVDMDKLLNADEDSDDGEEAEDEEDSDAAEEEEDDDEDDEDDDEEEESSSEEEVVAPAPKQNGVAKQPKTKKEKQEEAKSKNKKEQQQKTKEQKPVKKVLAGNVLVEDIKEGKGPVAANGKFVHVYYEGRLKQNNKMFDSTKKGPGFGFRLGKGEVIKGWDVGVSGMKVGGKRRITCPPNTAYGAKGSPPVIPPNSTLVFEVELKQVG